MEKVVITNIFSNGTGKDYEETNSGSESDLEISSA
jgi:hypothetical protein